MYKKNKIIIEIDDMTKFNEINTIITKHCELEMGGPKDFDIPGNSNADYRAESGLYKIVENHTFNDLIKELGPLCKYITFKDVDSKEVLQYIGKLIIRFDKIKHLKVGTYDKINEFNGLKNELGCCKKQDLNPNGVIGPKPLEGTDARFMSYSEVLILVSESLDNLVKLDLLIENKLLEFDSNFELNFELFD